MKHPVRIGLTRKCTTPNSPVRWVLPMGSAPNTTLATTTARTLTANLKIDDARSRKL
jgi:hypothetical protein